jgi:NadR type nicotinamide-nucleotide adenylyltransferase
MKTGFVVGKFYPFHLGHMYLLDVARAYTDTLTVFVCEKASQDILGSTRAAWIQELYPGVTVLLIPDTLDDNDTLGWASYTKKILGRAPDIVFTSEEYGRGFAKALGAKHVLVDIRRNHLPVSGTKIRSNPKKYWEYLSPPVRADLTKRVVVLGAESTGTTTLAHALSEHYHTSWVEEYGREYSLRKAKNNDTSWDTKEFVHIASEQIRRENEAARSSSGVLICDTDAFATTLWHKRYMGFFSEEVGRICSPSRIPS